MHKAPPFVKSGDCRPNKIEIYNLDAGKHVCSVSKEEYEYAIKSERLSDLVEAKKGFRLDIVPSRACVDLAKHANEWYFDQILGIIQNVRRTGINPVPNARPISDKFPNLSEFSIKSIIHFAKYGTFITDHEYARVPLSEDNKLRTSKIRAAALRGATGKDKEMIKDFFGEYFQHVNPDWATDVKIRKNVERDYGPQE